MKTTTLKPVGAYLPKNALCDICGSFAEREEEDLNYICQSCGFTFDPFTTTNKYIYERAIMRKRLN